MTPATCVPWPVTLHPCRHSDRLPDTIFLPLTRPARSGWAAAIPESTTPTFTPRPRVSGRELVDAHSEKAPVEGFLGWEIGKLLLKRDELDNIVSSWIETRRLDVRRKSSYRLETRQVSSASPLSHQRE